MSKVYVLTTELGPNPRPDIKRAFSGPDAPERARHAAGLIGGDKLEWTEHDSHGKSWTAQARRGSYDLHFAVIEVDLYGQVLRAGAEREEVEDRLIGMLEASEAENRALRELIAPCDDCGPLFETPFYGCNDVGIEPHRCPLREEGILGPKDFLCTCCGSCTTGCLHAV